MRVIKSKIQMTDDQKLEMAWNDMHLAIHEHDLNRIFRLAYIIKAYLKKAELPVIE